MQIKQTLQKKIVANSKPFNPKKHTKIMANELIGMAGLLLIFIGWLPGIVDTIKTKEPGMKKRFMVSYFLGSSFLAIYAWQLDSKPFIILNALAAIVPIVHLYYYLKKHGTKKLLTPTEQLK
ncbi:MAG: hypothetical protein COV47_04690 [Candidatus Diapherotrites archaeon CG11_big_fil_rev_8_21_14_0_20_37_9]|nr:MAG: hypothetical protein COV47_04690 [Candidatus Diapherotrites archaeon CG11_big_fil_rev_8_21_14_0_20_37_9]